MTASAADRSAYNPRARSNKDNAESAMYPDADVTGSRAITIVSTSRLKWSELSVPSKPETIGSCMSVATYRQFLEALNAKDLREAAGCVDVEQYEENCVGFTPGFVSWSAAAESLQKVWEGIPDLHVELVDVFGDDQTVLARGSAAGTNTGRLYGVPATRRGYRVTFFDSCTFEDGKIVRRVQQADVITQMRQLYGRGIGSLGLLSSIVRVDPTAPPF